CDGDQRRAAAQRGSTHLSLACSHRKIPATQTKAGKATKATPTGMRSRTVKIAGMIERKATWAFHGTIEKGRIIMYRRIGILSFSSPGHFYPLTALGRRLQSRGHDVVYFQVADLESPIRAAGLRFRQIGEHDFPLGSLRARDEECGNL